jgi:hypothetical protein
MFGFIKSYYPTLHKQFSELENSRKVYFDNKNTWNTILIHNVNLNPHYEHLLIVEIEQHIGKIKNIQDIYCNSKKKTLSITFDWWYNNDFTRSLSDKMEEKIFLENCEIFNQVEIFYMDEQNNIVNNIVELVM